MMKKPAFIWAAAAIAFGSTGMAQAAEVVDFETGSLSSGGIYTQNGFTVSVSNFTGLNADLQGAQNPGNASQIFAFCSATGPCTAGTSLMVTNGGIFSFLGFDAANWQFENAPGTLNLSGTLAGGGQVTQAFTLGDFWQSYSASNFTNLTSLLISTTGTYAGAIDNAAFVSGEVGAVPEPGTWAMMLLGIGGVGFSLRRRTKRQTTLRYA